MKSLSGRRRTALLQVGNDRQHPFGRAADLGAFFQRPAFDHARRVPRCGVYPRAHLDAALFAVRRLFGIRYNRRMFRGLVLADTCAGNGAVFRSFDEPPRAHARRVHDGLQFGRAFSVFGGIARRRCKRNGCAEADVSAAFALLIRRVKVERFGQLCGTRRMVGEEQIRVS